jgi:hypothetical protein
LANNVAKSFPAVSVLATGLVVLAAAPVVAFYAGRVVDPLPLYAFDEGTYLIRTLYGDRMTLDPTLQPNVGELTNSVHFALLRVVSALASPDLPWIRIASLAAYVAGLALTWLTVRPQLSRGQAWGFLLLAVLFPYYRFVVTAMPEGWYVGGFGLIVWVTARLYGRRPLAHALLAGLLTAALSLVKPHGIAVAAALAALPVLDAALGDRRWKLAAARLALFVASYLAVGNLIQTLAHQSSPSPLLFFQAPYYSALLGAPTSPNAWPLTLIVAAAMAGAVAMFAGVPIVAGLADLLGRWRTQRRLPAEPWDRALMLVALSFGATLAMTLAFTFRATFYESEILRVWGRYFEFFAPLAWLAAAPAIVRLEAQGSRRWRVAACGLVLAGLGALLFAFHKGVVLFPWDSTALTAFYRPDAARFALATGFPFRTLAVTAMAAAAFALLTPLASVRIWQGGFLALALLSMGADKLFVDAGDIGRQVLRHDLEAAKAIVAQRPGRLFAIADDGNVDRIVFLELLGRPHMRIAAPLEPITAADAAPNETILVQGQHPIQGPPWRPLYVGQALSVYGKPAGR